jgi:hypothetical protein
LSRDARPGHDRCGRMLQEVAGPRRESRHSRALTWEVTRTKAQVATCCND